MRQVLGFMLLVAGLYLGMAYPLASLPVWARATIAVLVYSVCVGIDYSITKRAIARYGVEAEENEIYRFAIRRFGFALGFLAANAFAIGLLTLMNVLLLQRSFPDNLLAALLLVGFVRLDTGLGNWLLINYGAGEKMRP